MIISKPLIPVIAGGMAASSFGGVYVCSLQKLKDFLRNELLGYDESHNGDWKILQTSLNKDSSYQYLVISGLDKIQDKSSASPEKGDQLRDWCKGIAGTYISTDENLNTPWQNAIIDAARKFCILTIQNKLEKPIDLGGSEVQKFLQKNVSKLRSSGEEEKLTEELSYIKTKSKEEDAWKDLKDWCGAIYTRGYNDPQDLDWVSAQKYCQQVD